MRQQKQGPRRTGNAATGEDQYGTHEVGPIWPLLQLVPPVIREPETPEHKLGAWLMQQVPPDYRDRVRNFLYEAGKFHSAEHWWSQISTLAVACPALQCWVDAAYYAPGDLSKLFDLVHRGEGLDG